MNRMTIVTAVGLALAGALPAAPAQAGAARTFVSPTGSDSNNCSLVAPCRFFQAAFAQTNAGGEIAVLGTAGYNNGATFTIDKAISIVNPGGFEAGIVVPSGGTGIVINAGASDAVSLRGLTIEGGGTGSTGIAFGTGNSLIIENCVVRNLTSSGIAFAPNATSSLKVSNTLVTNNGGHGIYIQPSGTGTFTAIFNRVEAHKNSQNGIGVYGNASTGLINVTAVDSIASNNEQGFVAYSVSGNAVTTLTLVHSVAANNLFCVQAVSAVATIRLAQSTVAGCIFGIESLTGGVVQSYGDNYIDDIGVVTTIGKR